MKFNDLRKNQWKYKFLLISETVWFSELVYPRMSCDAGILNDRLWLDLIGPEGFAEYITHAPVRDVQFVFFIQFNFAIYLFPSTWRNTMTMTLDTNHALVIGVIEKKDMATLLKGQ